MSKQEGVLLYTACLSHSSVCVLTRMKCVSVDVISVHMTVLGCGVPLGAPIQHRASSSTAPQTQCPRAVHAHYAVICHVTLECVTVCTTYLPSCDHLPAVPAILCVCVCARVCVCVCVCARACVCGCVGVYVVTSPVLQASFAGAVCDYICPKQHHLGCRPGEGEDTHWTQCKWEECLLEAGKLRWALLPSHVRQWREEK